MTGLQDWILTGLPQELCLRSEPLWWPVPLLLLAALVGSAIRRLGLILRPQVERRMLLATPVAGLAIAALAIAFAAGTGKSSSEVLFSGQEVLRPLITHSAGYTVGTLLVGSADSCVISGYCRRAEPVPMTTRPTAIRCDRG